MQLPPSMPHVDYGMSEWESALKCLKDTMMKFWTCLSIAQEQDWQQPVLIQPAKSITLPKHSA